MKKVFSYIVASLVASIVLGIGVLPAYVCYAVSYINDLPMSCFDYVVLFVYAYFIGDLVCLAATKTEEFVYGKILYL